MSGPQSIKSGYEWDRRIEAGKASDAEKDQVSEECRQGKWRSQERLRSPAKSEAQSPLDFWDSTDLGPWKAPHPVLWEDHPVGPGSLRTGETNPIVQVGRGRYNKSSCSS